MGEDKMINYITLVSEGVKGFVFLIHFTNPNFGATNIGKILSYVLLTPILFITGFLFLLGIVIIFIIRPFMKISERRSRRKKRRQK